MIYTFNLHPYTTDKRNQSLSKLNSKPSASGTITCLKLLHVQQEEMIIVHCIIVLRDTMESSRYLRVLRISRSPWNHFGRPRFAAAIIVHTQKVLCG